MTNVVFSELPCINHCKIGLAELNNPKALNALSLSMVRLLHQQLKVWETDRNIAFVILQGTGDKAFCAGGDVVGLYNEIKSATANNITLDDDTVLNGICGDFFKEEYSLDLYIHTYKKPIVVWGDGYVFGGGMGLFAGASHRITTENTIMAMPETAIGLYPEVGASWFLNKMPNNVGLFLGLTGSFFNASDAKYLGLSNFTIHSTVQQKVFDKFCATHWTIDATDHIKLNEVLNQYEADSIDYMPESLIKDNENIIASLTTEKDVDAIVNSFLNCKFDNKWLTTAQNKLRNASPLSILLTYTQLQLTMNYSKEECFEAEFNLSLKCCQYGEFFEGVRAQLVDKDKKPRWAFDQINEIEPSLISWFFSPIQ